MLIIRTDLEIVISGKIFLSAQLSMKDLGAADIILRIKTLYTKDEIVLSQYHYIDNMLKKYSYFDLPELFVPYDYNKKLGPDTGRPIR